MNPAPTATAEPSMNDAIDSIEGSDNPDSFRPDAPTASPTPTPAPAASEKPSEATPAPAEVKPPTPAPTPEATPAPAATDIGDDLKAFVKPSATATDVPNTPKELRAVYESTKAELAKREARIKELETGTDSVKKTAAEEARKAVDKELTELRQKVDEYEGKVRLTDYTQSEEYKTKFIEPMTKAWETAANDIQGIKVASADGSERDATVDDIAGLCRLQSRDAWRVAKDKFGDDAPAVMGHRTEILKLEQGRQQAVREYKEKAGTLRDQSVAERQRRIEDFSAGVKTIQTEYADLFGAPADDKEAAALLDKGNTLVRTAMIADNLPESTPPEQRAAMVTKAQQIVSARAAAFGTVYHRLQKAEARAKDLEAKLAKFTTAEPEPGGGGGNETKTSARGILDEIDDIPGFNTAGG